MQRNLWSKNYPKGVPLDIDLNSYASLTEVLERACHQYPEKIAFLNMGASLTFRELDRLSLRFAIFFQKDWGLKKGDRIIIQMPNLLQYPIVLFAALRAGLVVVNTNPLYTPREMKHQFIDSGAVAIVILSNFASKLQEILPDTKIQKVMITELGDLFSTPKRWLTYFFLHYVKRMVPFYLIEHTSFRKVVARSDQLGTQLKFEDPKLNHSDLAFLQYTGGTTGVSKGAMLTHKNIIANLLQISEWMKVGLTEGNEVIITALPLYHIFSLTVNCLGFFKQGMTNVLITNPRDISQLIKEINQTRPTAMTLVSTLLGALMEHPHFKTIQLQNLKISVAGGMALNQTVAKKWKQMTRTSVIEGYGLTEASPVVACNPIDGQDRLGTIGLPLPSTEIQIVDGGGGHQEVEIGKEGELCVRGPQVMKGYWNQPAETSAVLTSEGWLKTGDMAVIDDLGFLRIVDRKKDMILVSGFNVYPSEIEEVMMKHPQIREAAAVGVEDPHSGEVVKLFVVSRIDSLTQEEVIAFARKELTGYKVPKYVEFRTELPKTNVGKFLRRELREKK